MPEEEESMLAKAHAAMLAKRKDVLDEPVRGSDGMLTARRDLEHQAYAPEVGGTDPMQELGNKQFNEIQRPTAQPQGPNIELMRGPDGMLMQKPKPEQPERSFLDGVLDFLRD